MATSAYHSTAPARPAARRRPDPARVYQTYLAERAIAEWGAFTRTAARYRKPDGTPYTDEWARKTVKQWEAKQAAANRPNFGNVPSGQNPNSLESSHCEGLPVDELAYVPPPGALPEPQPRPTNDLLRQLLTAELPTFGADLPTAERDITTAANVDDPNSQPATDANSQPVELEDATTPAIANFQPARPAYPQYAVPNYRHVPPPAEVPSTNRPTSGLLSSGKLVDDVVTYRLTAPVVATRVEHRGGLVQWCQEHDAAARQLLAVATVLLLICLCVVAA